MKKILFLSTFLFFSLNISVFADEKKCGTFDIGCKTKKFIDDTKNYQKKGFDQSKEQVGKTTKKILKGKDIVIDDVKDAVGGVTSGVKGAVDGVKNEIKK